MKVRELIRELHRLNEDLKIVSYNENGKIADLEGITVCKRFSSFKRNDETFLFMDFLPLQDQYNVR